jgi:hypothetical protein
MRGVSLPVLHRFDCRLGRVLSEESVIGEQASPATNERLSLGARLLSPRGVHLRRALDDAHRRLEDL